jgi:hypothetical protein
MHCGSVLIKYDKICKKILAIFVSLNKYILKIYIFSNLSNETIMHLEY